MRSPHPPYLFALVVALLLALFPQAGPIAHGQEASGQDAPVEDAQLAAISPQLAAQLEAAGGPVSFFIILEEQADLQAATAPLPVASAGTKGRGQAIYAALTASAESSQAPLRAWLEAHGIAYRPFYIVNMIEVRGDAQLAAALRTLPGVDRLAANPRVIEQAPPPTIDAAGAVSPAALPYGLAYTHAPEVWALGFRGQGIVIASQDTGVQWDHPALIEHYRGWNPATSSAGHVYNWYDAWDDDNPGDPCTGDPQVPCDDNGHGTHTVGTMVGDATPDGGTILGMAPDAKWIGCRNMQNGVGSPASYAACFQFMLAPYPQGGNPFTEGRPELAPNIINNSWSCPPTEGCDSASLRQVVETARAAGQLVVASAGNYGNGCRSVQYPIGMHDAVFTVGAHDASGQIAGFSSRGPVSADGSNRLKPDLTAPGVAVFSTDRGASYSTKSGTSMSSPHVAGAAALLWSAVPTLTGEIDLTEQLLIKSATTVLSGECMPGDVIATPNPAYGYGRLDILNAVQMARNPSVVSVRVQGSGGVPIGGATVTLTDTRTGFAQTAVTSVKGIAWWPALIAGDYHCAVQSTLLPARRTRIVVRPPDSPLAGQYAVAVDNCQLLNAGHTLFVPQLARP